MTKRAEFGLLGDLLGRIPWGYNSREKRGPGEMIDFFQGSLPPRSGTSHPCVWEVRQRQKTTCVDEQETPSRTKNIKRKHARGRRRFK